MTSVLLVTVPLLFVLPPVPILAQDGKAAVVEHIESNQEKYGQVAQEIWDFAELGYMEEQSAALLESTLANAGFHVETGVAGMPTAFVATYGSGGPVVGILAEYDALPGMSQARVPVRQAVPGMESGHGCGHNLFGAGSIAAAIAVKDWLESSGTANSLCYHVRWVGPECHTRLRGGLLLRSKPGSGERTVYLRQCCEGCRRSSAGNGHDDGLRDRLRCVLTAAQRSSRARDVCQLGAGRRC